MAQIPAATIGSPQRDSGTKHWLSWLDNGQQLRVIGESGLGIARQANATAIAANDDGHRPRQMKVPRCKQSGRNLLQAAV